ncbi:MAG: RdgB/HAM1 family non-canonical purine NTP pyrophosphatase [Alphaproteobacteria bacterium]|nr:RdgB/HAM1 family non-canonical purine NTP pyrophosphatase [Alphaproteobacteria bacterium]
MRKFDTSELVIATHNKGKAREIADLLSPFLSSFMTADDLDLPEPEETGLTFADNAVLKAKAAALASGKVSLADDSGLAVNALNGEPGIYSARWGGPDKDFDLAMQKVWDALQDHDDTSACFICVLALAWPDGHVETFEGKVKGKIIWPKRGDKGFGYDPIFQADGYDMTFAEMNPEEKHKISHRSHAFQKLVQGCFEG